VCFAEIYEPHGMDLIYRVLVLAEVCFFFALTTIIISGGAIIPAYTREYRLVPLKRSENNSGVH
jgi:hypothetical protein